MTCASAFCMGCAGTHPEPLCNASCPHCVQLHDGGAFTSSAPLSGHPARLATKSVVVAPARLPKESFIRGKLHRRMAVRSRGAFAIGSCPSSVHWCGVFRRVVECVEDVPQTPKELYRGG